MQFRIGNLEDWETASKNILPVLNHSILLLKGDLGAGKTTFTKSLLKKLGSKDTITSPTYSIVNEYECPKGKIFHLDLYRLKSLDEAQEIGIEEYLDQAFLIIIEWPEIYMDALQDMPCHELIINKKNTHEREVFFL
ncbi:MAG: tRNA (adenosine(37)-N6)-threonylcarbamoyltransferase complex ATPase subunit type 1 TsaE [Bergeyella sp.]|nr:tRNA (adenosine(37)-N6)-threonylcarbamoyltransferase complex ATPase subunit type 1 TsaE [Bergeyella sp.]